MRHLLIAASVLLVVLVEQMLGWRRQRRARERRPWPDRVIEEHLSSSGSFKAVVYPHEGAVMRVEVFAWITDEPSAPFWRRVSGPSFVDKGSLRSVVEEALHTAGR